MIFSKFGGWEDFSKEMTKALTMIVMYMRKIFAFLFLTIGVLACTPQDLPVEDDKTPDVETPAPDQKPGQEPDPAPEPEPLPAFESSYEAVANMGVGWNLGNTLETLWSGNTDGRDWKAWETGWGQAVTKPELMTMMRDAGFGAIRVPVSWGVHTDADGKVYDEWMNRVQEVVDYVLNAGMYCIINVHHDTGADEELAWLVASAEGYARERQRYEGLWRQIAERFKNYDHIKRLGGKARAAGIHVILATQRPSTDVIKGTMKNNVPTRIAFKVSSPVDSSTILDHGGAEKLLGMGDMLFSNEDGEERIQGAYVSDDELSDIVEFLTEHNEVSYLLNQEQLLARATIEEVDDEEDELFEEVALFVVRNENGSSNAIQTTFNVSFNRTKRMLSKMEKLGILSPTVAGKPRTVLVNEEELYKILDDNK